MTQSGPRGEPADFFAIPNPARPMPRQGYVGGSVSVNELRNPLEGKALDIIRDAQRSLASGEQARAMEQLRKALADPQAMPYAMGMLGTEHLKLGDLDTAIAELEQAVRLIPGKSATHNNLAYALGLKGDLERALAHARKAVQLDPGSTKSRYVLGLVLLQRGYRDEAEFYLRQAGADPGNPAAGVRPDRRREEVPAH